MGLTCDQPIEDLVITVSDRHPYLVNYVASLCAEMQSAGTPITGTALAKSFREPGSPMVTLIRQMREHLTATEKQWLDTARNAPDQLRQVQRDLLRKLWEYGLIQPGVQIQ